MPDYNVALAGADLTTYQTTKFAADWYLSVADQATFATARINQTVFTNPISQLTVDTTSADWLNAIAGMTVWIGTTAGTHDIGIYRVRKAPGATTLYVMELATGDPGLQATRIPAPLADDAYVTIINDFNLWSVFPRITWDGTTGTIYKDFEETYNGQNTASGNVPFVINIGEHIAVKIADAATYTDSRTVTITSFDSTTIDTIAWTVDSAGTYSTGSSSTATIGVDYPPGNYIVRCTVTDTSGVSQTATRIVNVHGDTDNPALEINIDSYREPRTGAFFSISLADTFDADLTRGSMVILFAKLGSTAISTGYTRAIGFVDTVQGEMEPGVGRAAFDVIPPLELLGRLQGFSQELRVAASPANWQEASAALMHLDFYLFYLLRWHTTLWSLFDYTPGDLSSFTSSIWRSEYHSWLESVNQTASLVLGHELTQDAHGNLYLKPNPDLKATGSRPISRVTLNEDLVERVTHARKVRAETGKVEVLAFSVGTGTPTAYRSMAHGNTGGQGSKEKRLNGLRLADQTETNRIAGCVIAEENNSYPRITLDLASRYHALSPAQRYFVTLDITDANLLPEGVALDWRGVVEEISIDFSSGVPKLSLTIQSETNGNSAVGQTMPLIAQDNVDVTLPEIGLDGIPLPAFDLFLPPDPWGLPQFPELENVTSQTGTPDTGYGYTETTEAVLWGSVSPADGAVYYCADFTQGLSATWTQRASVTSVDVMQCLPAKDSRVAVYGLWSNSLRYTADIATTNMTELTAITGNASLMRMVASGALVIFGNTSGTNWIRIWNGTLGSQINVAASSTGEMSGDVDDHGQGIIVMPASGQIYASTTYGGAFTQLSGLTGVTGNAGDEITIVRIPYKKANLALNNNPAAMEFVYSINSQATYRATYNFVSNSVVGSPTDITYSSGGNPCGVFSAPLSFSTAISYGHTLETYAGNSNLIMAGMSRSGVFDSVVSSNNGSTWSSPLGSAGVEMSHMVHWVEPARGGDGLKAWAGLANGLTRTTDRWATVDEIAMPGDLNNPQLPRGIFQL